MKTCTYCGKEYSDETTICETDGEPLRLETVLASMADSNVMAGTETQLNFPEYQWSARDAWKCIGMILVLSVCFALAVMALSSLFPVIRLWRSSGYGYFSIGVIGFTIWTLTVTYFARTQTFYDFWKAIGLHGKPTDLVWFGISMALVIRFSEHLLLVHGWGNGVFNEGLAGFRHALGIGRFLFLFAPVILSPFFEEIVNRGFIYKAFRGSYSVAATMTLMMGWTAVTHWGYFTHSLLASLDLSLLAVVLCFLREKSDSLWDCVFCHFTYNVSNLFTSRVFQ